MHYRRRFFVGIICSITFIICSMMGISCGRKAPPLPPKSYELPVVEDLVGNCTDGRLELIWTAPKGKDHGVDELAGFYIYRSREKQDEPGCSNCPDQFKKVADITYDKVTSLFQSKLEYDETLEKGYRYKFRVTSYSIYGDESIPSDVVVINY